MHTCICPVSNMTAGATHDNVRHAEMLLQLYNMRQRHFEDVYLHLHAPFSKVSSSA